MDIEALEKLANLKDKGLITQEEFETQKQKLMNDNPKTNTNVTNATKSKGICWENVGISFLIAILYLLFKAFIIVLIDNGDIKTDTLKNLSFGINIIFGIVMAIYASKLKMSQYKNCGGAGGTFIGIWIFGELGVWIIFYQILQIKQGNAVLKPVKQK